DGWATGVLGPRKQLGNGRGQHVGCRVPKHVERVVRDFGVVLSHEPTSIWTTLQVDIRALADAIGYPAAGLGILIESAGIPFPGETALLAVAAYAAAGNLDIRLVMVLGAAGAILGANLGTGRGYCGGAAPGGELTPLSPPRRVPYPPGGAFLPPPRRPNGVVRPVRAWFALLGVGDGRHVKDAHPDVRALHGHWRHCLGDRDRHPRLLPRLQLEPRRAPGQLPRPRWPG